MIDPTHLKVGDLIAFQISEQEHFSPINVGKWGVLKILATDGKDSKPTLTASVLRGIHKTQPVLRKVARNKVLALKRFANNAKFKTAIFTIPLTQKLTLLNPILIGHSDYRSGEEPAAVQAVAQNGHVGRMADWQFASIELDGEDRFQNDPAGFAADIAKSQAAFEEKMRSDRERERTRLKGLNLDVLSGETPFASWDQRTEVVPPAYTKAARQQAQQTLAALQTLGDKPKRADVRKSIEALAQWFNQTDGMLGYAIETEEREDIYTFLEELCWASKQKALVRELDDWRDW